MANRQRSGSRRRNGTGSSRRANGGRRKADALAMLKADHARVQSLFEEFEKADEREKRELAETICSELTLHAQLEEQIFYPAVREAIDDEEIMKEAEIEHGSVKELVAKIESSGPADDSFDALVKVLGEYVKHHVKEEEGEMFKQIRRTDLDLAALAERMEQFKGTAGVEIEPD